jgi:pyrimidine dimer DNA glycosylase
MRLWSLHPQYLDARGLVALWREALLAKAVLRGRTQGYRRHPQLERFRLHASARLAINAYLAAIHAEATARGYAFDRSRIGPVRTVEPIRVTHGQLAREREHLLAKLAVRDPARALRLQHVARPDCHPSFLAQPGPVASWERSTSASAD